MSVPVNERLCGECRNVFQGHWQRRPLDEGPDVLSDDEQYEERDIESEFYERPDWVRLPSALNSNDAEPESPSHHGISSLRASALNGCPLCAVIWDRASERLNEMDSRDQICIDDAVGVVTVRPAFDNEEEDAVQTSNTTLDLEISYFVDGNSHLQAAFLPLTVSLDLFPASRYPEVVAKIPDKSTNLPGKTVKAIIDWAQTCQHDHEDCWQYTEKAHSAKMTSGMPTRVLDVFGGKDEDQIRLIETSQIDSHSDYVTLSHCWGTNLPICLLTASYQKLLQGIDTNKLPQTFQDAVVFTRALQIRYLWIDALCIIQDSSEDWLRESLLMAGVYSFAYMNIAAAASVDGHGGLFKERAWDLMSPCVVHASWTGHPEGDYVCLDQSAWDRHIEKAHLNTRAWVFQERLLAPRTVHFASDQIWWECREIRANESFPDQVPDHGLRIGVPIVRLFVDLDNEDAISGYDTWLAFVETYTAMKLTYDSDKLIAIAGIALLVQANLRMWEPHDYVAGFWRHDLLTNLLWRVQSSGSRRLQTYIGPSWSWISVNGAVYFDSPENRALSRQNLTAQIEDLEIKYVGDVFGAVRNGSLTIRAHLHRISLLEPQHDGYPIMSKMKFGKSQIELNNGKEFVESLDEEELYEDSKTTDIQAVWCQIAASSTPHPQDQYLSVGLILQEAQDEEPGVYRRIGWSRLFHSETDVGFCSEFESQSQDINALARHDDGKFSIKLI